MAIPTLNVGDQITAAHYARVTEGASRAESLAELRDWNHLTHWYRLTEALTADKDDLTIKAICRRVEYDKAQDAYIEREPFDERRLFFPRLRGKDWHALAVGDDVPASYSVASDRWESPYRIRGYRLGYANGTISAAGIGPAATQPGNGTVDLQYYDIGDDDIRPVLDPTTDPADQQATELVRNFGQAIPNGALVELRQAVDGQWYANEIANNRATRIQAVAPAGGIPANGSGVVTGVAGLDGEAPADPITVENWTNNFAVPASARLRAELNLVTGDWELYASDCPP